MTPDEMYEYLHNRFIKDMKVFNRLVEEQKERHNALRTQPEIRPLLEKVTSFYADLIADGHIKKDFSLFEHDEIKDWKFSQSRTEYISILDSLDQRKSEDYHEIFRKWNRGYVTNYETIIDVYLVEPAQKIVGKRISSKARVLDKLRSYREGKHSELFRSLIPQIRNSIQHQDTIIDPKKPKITFYDREKEPLSLTLEEYAQIFWEGFFLSLAFDVAWFDLRKDIIEILLEAVNTVDEFLKTHEQKLSPKKEGGLSILDLALLIKEGKLA